MKCDVSVYDYVSNKSQLYHFASLKDAVEFAKSMKKTLKDLKKPGYISINFYV